jgi:hypothetical protein
MGYMKYGGQRTYVCLGRVGKGLEVGGGILA